jgi:hypothetical protein
MEGAQLKAILIDPWQKSIERIDIRNGNDRLALEDLHKLVGEDGLDFAYIMAGECVAVGDHSALHEPPLPSYRIEGHKHRLYGCGVVLGFHRDGTERETRLSVDDISQLITWH